MYGLVGIKEILKEKKKKEVMGILHTEKEREKKKATLYIWCTFKLCVFWCFCFVLF